MQEGVRGLIIKYFITALSVVVFVILYVWQNVEVMKIKIDYRKALKEERQLINMNDRLKYEIERYKRMDMVERYAAENGMRELTPHDFVTINME
ncbi:MAG: hypothetical protein V1874_17320 [Spirochaetota bacterium]